MDYYSPRNSPSLTKDWSELSELDVMLSTQLETEGLISGTTTDEPIDDTTPEEETPASEWIILDSIGTMGDF